MNIRQFIHYIMFVLCLSLPTIDLLGFSFFRKHAQNKEKKEAVRPRKSRRGRKRRKQVPVEQNLEILTTQGQDSTRMIMLAQNEHDNDVPTDLTTHGSIQNLVQPEHSKKLNQKEIHTLVDVPRNPAEEPAIQKKETNLVNTEVIKEKNKEIHASNEEAMIEERIEFNFENADLENLIKQIEDIYEITFIPDDVIQPIIAGGKAVKGNKISFRTHKPLSKKEAWNLFLTFLDIAGFSIVPSAQKGTYRIKSIETTRKSPIPAYIGVDLEQLPDSDEFIRYVYFIQNSTTEALQGVIDALRSNVSGPLIILQEHKGFILTDKAYNIKTLMRIVKELDKVAMPQAMSVLKLRRADAQQVKELYDSLIQQDAQAPPRYFGPRKRPTSIYFPENIRIIAEPRTNALVLLGQQDAIRKIEEFIIKHVDVELDKPYAGIHTYQLKYADATTIADIMNSIAQFGQTTPAGKSGGVRGEDKYLKPMTFTAEKSTNKIIITGDYNDYLIAKEILDKLDEPQKQVAIEVLILSIELNDIRELGSQIRSKDPGPDGFIGKNVKFQTSGLRRGGTPAGIIQNPQGSGVQRLLGDLIGLVTGANQAGPGNTILTLGADSFGVWGVFQALQTVANMQIVSNPFLVATNKTAATVSVGDERRVVSSTIVGTQQANSFTTDEAKLEVKITPQITSDGFILLKLDIQINDFLDPTNPTSAEKNERQVVTQTIIADKEVLALGGLIRNRIEDNLSKTPILGDIPVIGWLFKNKRKSQRKENLLILISSRIVEPQLEVEVREFTKDRIADYDGTLDDMYDVSEKREPIHRAFFAEKKDSSAQVLDDFLFKREKAGRKRRKTRGKKEQNNNTIISYVAPETKVVKQKENKNEVVSSLPKESQHSTQNALYEKIKEKNRTKLVLTDFLSKDDGGSQA